MNTPPLAPLLGDPKAGARPLVHLPMGRLAEADEVASTTRFFACEDSGYLDRVGFFVGGGASDIYVMAE